MLSVLDSRPVAGGGEPDAEAEALPLLWRVARGLDRGPSRAAAVVGGEAREHAGGQLAGRPGRERTAERGGEAATGRVGSEGPGGDPRQHRRSR